ncbi:hypothetical protein F4083_12150 [Candidatus Poribacteria bacterium]|nr:hypothetical protein [Candidatus Poribacteria bacterium]MYF55485.1 hypothetical protein [Candidatus Poribacteria bacterium]MYI95048.1 hypothetical protein [Candidatus Poribacteria bacterium]
MKPTIMILGSTYLHNPGLDVYNFKMDDVLAPKRQDEIKKLVQQLKPFQPTKIAVEQDPSRTDEINRIYQDYLNDVYELQRWEGEQLGFRLAKQMEHPKVYCVDHFRHDDPMIHLDEIDRDLVDYFKFAKENDQENLFPKYEDFSNVKGKRHKDKNGATWVEPDQYESLIDMYRRWNQPESLYNNHRVYFRIAQIGKGDQYPGANWVGHLWFARNLKIYVNLTRIIESANDRILLIIGSGHKYLIQQFLEESEEYNIESPLDYLKAEVVNS